MTDRRASNAVVEWRFGDPLERLQAVLAGGGVIAIPSESSYGLAADPRDPRGVEAIYEIKGRSGSKALPVVAADAAQLVDLGVPSDHAALAWAERHWPAPLTVILPIAAPLPASAGYSTLAARVPAHAELRGLLARLGCALTSTSANRSGEAPILEPEKLVELMRDSTPGPTPVIINAGRLPGGPPSTLVEWRAGEFQVLRAGAFPADHLARHPPPRTPESQEG